jgi:hypothetical protein
MVTSLWDELYPWCVSAIGGGLGAALLLVPKWGEVLIQSKTGRILEAFKAEQSRHLEQLKAEQNSELERLKSEQNRQLEQFKEQLNHLGDRGRRSNEMKFNSIETTWKGFVKAWLSTNTCVQGMISVPEFEKMPDEEVKKYAASYGFTDDEQTSLLTAQDRNEEYVKIVKWKNTMEAGRDIYQARLTLREQRIFMPPELTRQFNDVIERMSNVQVEQRLSLAHRRDWDHRGPSAAWISDCIGAFEDIAAKANKRLFRGETGAS